MFLRIHRSDNNHEVVGICDRELIGKTITDGDLSISITEPFFGDHIVSEEEVISVLKKTENATLYGDRCVNLAINEGIIDKENCRRVGGVLIAVIIRL